VGKIATRTPHRRFHLRQILLPLSSHKYKHPEAGSSDGAVRVAGIWRQGLGKLALERYDQPGTAGSRWLSARYATTDETAGGWREPESSRVSLGNAIGWASVCAKIGVHTYGFGGAANGMA